MLLLGTAATETVQVGARANGARALLATYKASDCGVTNADTLTCESGIPACCSGFGPLDTCLTNDDGAGGQCAADTQLGCCSNTT